VTKIVIFRLTLLAHPEYSLFMKSNIEKDPGFGSIFQQPVSRLLNIDGSYNILRKGGLTGIQDFYKFLLEIKWYWFLLAITLFYILMNLVFTSLYLIVGIDQLKIASNTQSDFFNAFFFSAQTFTTLGYGSISPNGKAADIIAMIEAFFGLLSFAIATGLLYGRFSRPSTKIAFSNKIIITPYEDSQAAMFKMVNLRKNVLLNTKVRALFIIDKGTSQEEFNKTYYSLHLESDSVNFFPLTWTVVHKISPSSPLFGLNVATLKKRNAEVVIMIETFDETFAQTVIQKHSYAQNQWAEGVKFDRNFRSDEKGNVVLHIDELDNVSPV
jgi:inward rectifier potassium channel